MGVIDKFLSTMHMNGDDDYDDDYDDYLDDEDEVEETPVKKFSATKESVTEDVTPVKKPMTKMPNTRSSKRSSLNTNDMEVCVIKPTSVEDAKEITETLLKNRTVVLNLEGIDVDIAQRIIDFTSGSCYAISGNLQKISHYIFIITPASVDISGDFQEILSGSFDVPINNGY